MSWESKAEQYLGERVVEGRKDQEEAKKASKSPYIQCHLLGLDILLCELKIAFISRANISTLLDF